MTAGQSPSPKITEVSFDQSLLDRIINSGSLRIESADDSPDERLRNMPHSNTSSS